MTTIPALPRVIAHASTSLREAATPAPGTQIGHLSYLGRDHHSNLYMGERHGSDSWSTLDQAVAGVQLVNTTDDPWVGIFRAGERFEAHDVTRTVEWQLALAGREGKDGVAYASPFYAMNGEFTNWTTTPEGSSLAALVNGRFVREPMPPAEYRALLERESGASSLDRPRNWPDT